MFLPPPPGEISQESHDTDPEGEHWRRGVGDVCGVLPTCVDISGIPGGGVNGKDTQPVKTQRKIHV